jgi:hypothetical protein
VNEKVLPVLGAVEPRPDKRDFGYIVIGLTLGIALGGFLTRYVDGTFLIVFTIGLSGVAVSSIRSSLR